MSANCFNCPTCKFQPTKHWINHYQRNYRSLMPLYTVLSIRYYRYGHFEIWLI